MDQSSFRGFSLLEVLMALTVLSVGMLGILALQVQTARLSQSTHHRTVSLQLASDVAEQIGQMPGMLLEVDRTHGWDSDSGGDSTATATSCFGNRPSCNPAQMVAFAQYEWQQQLRVRLPNGRLRICHDGHPWNTRAMQPRWDCDDNPQASLWIKIGWLDDTSRHGGGQEIPPPRLLLPVSRP